MINNLDEVKKFLCEHKNPSIKTATTIYDGFVICIQPIPTICGAELITSPNTINELNDLVKASAQRNRRERLWK